MAENVNNSPPSETEVRERIKLLCQRARQSKETTRTLRASADSLRDVRERLNSISEGHDEAVEQLAERHREAAAERTSDTRRAAALIARAIELNRLTADSRKASTEFQQATLVALIESWGRVTAEWSGDLQARRENLFRWLQAAEQRWGTADEVTQRPNP